MYYTTINCHKMEKKEPPKNDEVAPQEITRGDLIKIHKVSHKP